MYTCWSFSFSNFDKKAGQLARRRPSPVTQNMDLVTVQWIFNQGINSEWPFTTVTLQIKIKEVKCTRKKYP